MRVFGRILLLLLLLAGVGWISWRIEFGGRTLMDRITGAHPSGGHVAAGTAPPMEDVSDEDRQALDRLVHERGD